MFLKHVSTSGLLRKPLLLRKAPRGGGRTFCIVVSAWQRGKELCSHRRAWLTTGLAEWHARCSAHPTVTGLLASKPQCLPEAL